MAKQLNFGVIGCGGIARNAHLPAIKKVEEAQLIAVSDVDSDKAESAAVNFGAKCVYGDYTDVINHSEVDAVVICTPPKFHKDIAIAAAKKEKHILCEKPIAKTVEEGKGILKAAEDYNVKVAVGENKHFNPAFRKMKELMDEGVIGKPFMARYQNSYYEPHTRNGWWVNEDLSGGGEMMNELTHQVNTLRWFFGEVTQVAAMTNHPAGPSPEDNACVTLRFENDVIATVTVSWMTRHYNLTFPAPLDHAWDERIEVFGEWGTIIVETPIIYFATPAQLRVYTEKKLDGFAEGWNYIKVGIADLYVGQIRHFVDHVLNNVPHEVTGKDGLYDLAVVRAAYESEASNKMVRL